MNIINKNSLQMLNLNYIDINTKTIKIYLLQLLSEDWLNLAFSIYL
jgi:hypothetical protein